MLHTKQFKSLPAVVGRLFLFLILGFSFFPSQALCKAIPVTLQQSSNGWELLRNGKPYVIRGAGGDASLQLLASAGANSVRTWSTSNAAAILDRAHELGLTVTLGIWLGHERHGFDYTNKEHLSQQLERVRSDVLRFRDHPALLLWGIGNEMEGFEDGDNPAIWSAVQEIAVLVKSLDPHHPTMTVTAEIGGRRVDNVHNHLPGIDIHGVNSYAGAASLEQRLKKAGANKPIVITEFGPPGSWEAQTTTWGAPIELTSAQKGVHYKSTYRLVAENKSGFFLGSYAFLWGQKVEATETWFGMFIDNKWKLNSVDVMTELWSGTRPENLAPLIAPLRLDGPQELEPGDIVSVNTSMTDPDDDAINTNWVLRYESDEYFTGGDFRRPMPEIDSAIIEGTENGARIRMPDAPGAYRLFAYVNDGVTSAATANIPLFVKGKISPRLPIDLYYEGFEGMPWSPSGWMGGTEDLSIDGSHTENPQSGSTAVKIRYSGEFGWAGVAWQHPENNWGDKDGGIDLTGATAIELWARGEYGGEEVGFGVGLIGKDMPFPDSSMTSKNTLLLSKEWQRFTVSLKGLNLTSIKTGFVIRLVGRQTPVTIYLDNIRFIN